MKIGFFGTPDIGAFCLRELARGFEVLFAVTGEDKPAGRHRHLQASPVKEAALELGIPVLQPAKLRDAAFVAGLKEYSADAYVVVAYGRLIPREIFDHPPLKTVNLHPSLLPRYRGAAPVEWALMLGEEQTGITVQVINEKLDAGDILAQEVIGVGRDTTAGALYDIVLPRGAALLADTLRRMEAGDITPLKQNEADATYCGKIDRDLARVDWARPAAEIHNLVRGLNPKPVAWTEFRGKNMRLWATSLPGDAAGIVLAPGELHVHNRKRLLAGAGGGVVEILGIQPETKKAMDGLSFINGYRIQAGERLG
jgi:methionyl-tRNA formyltransferase